MVFICSQQKWPLRPSREDAGAAPGRRRSAGGVFSFGGAPRILEIRATWAGGEPPQLVSGTWVSAADNQGGEIVAIRGAGDWESIRGAGNVEVVRFPGACSGSRFRGEFFPPLGGLFCICRVQGLRIWILGF
ncbi:hypothetical protein M758_4G231000 [Ceratodon purpureus]|uniref:Uncharacterized protein n=1 Tax=Ceratodon purpureus TaxID=3225 RepID=A0A8T0IBK9_CERPU|nr:hypothetical protein KC19_4G226200 [Ceratodon purpureus]KAG0620629.1 hypothetical protein M758_4G231000 [Ceratodon purpureus]